MMIGQTQEPTTLMLESPDEFLASLRQQHESDPTDLEVASRLAQCYTDRGWFNEAMELYQRLYEVAPDNYSIVLEYGNVSFMRKDYNKAAELFTHLTHLRSDRVEAWNNLGIVRHLLQDLEGACEAFEKVLDIEPQNAGALLNMGNYYFGQQKFTLAKEYFEKAVEVQADYTDGWFNLGNCYLRTSEYQSAIQAYQKALRYENSDASIHKNLGFAHECNGDLEKAVEFYQKAASMNRADASVQVNLAKILMQQKRFEDAYHCLFKAVRLAPRELNGWQGLRKVALLKGDLHTYKRATLTVLNHLDTEEIIESLDTLCELEHFRKAADILEQALRLGRKSDTFDVFRLIIGLHQGESMNKSSLLFKKLSAGNSADTLVNKYLAQYALTMGAYEHVMSFIKKISVPDRSTIFIRWRAMIALGLLDQASSDIETYLSSRDDDAVGYYLLAKVHAIKGLHEQARNLLFEAFEKGFTDIDEVRKDTMLYKLVKDSQPFAIVQQKELLTRTEQNSTIDNSASGNEQTLSF